MKIKYRSTKEKYCSFLKSVITISLMSTISNVYAGFEAHPVPETSVTVNVHNTKSNVYYSRSDAFSSPINIQFRGSCDKGWLTSFGLELGGAHYSFPGITGGKKSISGDNGVAWAIHSMTGQQVLPANNASLIQACNARLNGNTNLNFDSTFINVKTIPLRLNYTCRKRVGLGKLESTKSSVVDNLELSVRCMASNYVAPAKEVPTVVNKVQFRIDKQVTLGGACKVNLKGALNTNKPNQQIRFRYEHIDHSFNKRLSKIHQVTTDQQGYTNFSHEYSVANGPGKERGKMRIIGVSHKFQSAQHSYVMNCNNGAPGGLQQAGKGTVKLKAKPVKNSNKPFGHQICPTKIKFTGTIKAGSDFSGKAVFVGQSLADVQVKNFSIKKGQTKRLTRVRTLKWSAPSTTTLSTGGGASTKLMTQKVMQGLNIVGNNSQNVIISVPRKPFKVACTKASVQPGLQIQNGGLTTFPSHTGGGAPTDIQGKQQTKSPAIPSKPGSKKKRSDKKKKRNKPKS